MEGSREIQDILHRLKAAGWSVGDSASHRTDDGVTWLVFGWMQGVGENRIEARAGGQVAAWREAERQARGLGIGGGVWPRKPAAG